ncbi:MAG: DUF1667 domain-containing protein [Treponema sp.]|nr:DUF1667 domain-containing protein [Treponema sp.]MCL2250429.1 DUF1667 domain-containing protein [Treponema sp.]
MKNITCITCPISCRITVDIVDEIHIISGNKCSRGREYAKTEMMSPVRSLTTTVKTVFPNMPVLPVKTNRDVPKEMIPEIISKLANVLIIKNISIGEIIIFNILGSGCDIVATSEIK